MENREVQKWDVVIIGGGAAGLTAAAFAARAGKRVALFESASHFGGRAASVRTDGAVINLGPHAGLELYPDGGWNMLVQALGTFAETAGARLMTSCSVSQANYNGEAWVLRTGDGREVSAEHVICCIDPKRMAALFGEQLPLHYRESLRRIGKVSAACLDLHLRRLPRPDRTFVLGLDEPLYFSVHSEWAKVTSDSGHAVVHAMKYADGGMPNPQAVRHQLEHWLDRIQPGWREEVIWQRYMPRVTVAHAAPSVELGGARNRPQ